MAERQIEGTIIGTDDVRFPEHPNTIRVRVSDQLVASHFLYHVKGVPVSLHFGMINCPVVLMVTGVKELPENPSYDAEFECTAERGIFYDENNRELFSFNLYG
jgi:hypothetical protein